MRIGIDIGGTKIGFGLLDEEGKALFFEKKETEKEKGYESVLQKIKDSVLNILSVHGLTIRDLKRIGVACAGQVVRADGVIRFSPNLKWRDAPLKDDLESFFSVETIVENDVNAATYGEWKFSFMKIPKNVVGVFLGTGVGGGIIIDKRLYRGSEFSGGEIGHMILNPYGYICNCGARGCFEAFCGGEYIVKRVIDLINEGYRGKIWGLAQRDGKIHVSSIEEAYYLGDEAIKGLWEEVIEYLGCALTSIVNIFNPDLLILGGGVISGTKGLIREAEKIVQNKAMPGSKKGMKIERAKLGDLSAILGAAFLDD